jgi:hypothetical protein
MDAEGQLVAEHFCGERSIDEVRVIGDPVTDFRG